MIIDFFIRRPIFTSVCSFIFIVAGLICIPILPISQYPQLTPPMVTVSSTYTGASSEEVESAVTTPLEKSINGAEAMKYMTSQSCNDGTSTIQVTFDLERDEDIAAVDVQNRISSVMGTLPQEVIKTGVSISKKSTAMVSIYSFYSGKKEYDNIFISNFLDNFVVDTLKRINGVGDVTMVGQREYSMRLWLDPAKLASKSLTASDVVNVINEQNVIVPSGQIGSPPNIPSQQYQFKIKVRGRLTKPEEFDNMILKVDPNGSIIRIKDVGYSELGSQDYSTNLNFSQKPSVGLIIYQLADGNSLQIYKDVDNKLKELSKDFPPGLQYQLAVDTTSFVEDSIHEVVFTLVLSIFLVVCVIFFFLQSLRTTLIPVITIPVSLVGTFAVLKLFDMSINTLTLFGIVLATGLVVDDAIVVIENIQRNISEKGLTVIQAASEGMKEVTSAVVASTLVLAAVFLPVAGFGGTTGQLYKQFALTIVFSVAISLFNALTLTPALSALLLTNKEKDDWIVFKKVEQFIEFCRNKYHSLLKYVLNFKVVVLIVFVVMLGLTVYLLKTVPTGFVPSEDQGYFITTVQGPEGTSLNYIQKVSNNLEKIILSYPEIKDTFAITGFSLSGNGPNKAVIFGTLKPFKERKGDEHSAKTIVHKLNMQFAKITEAVVVAFEPPPIKGLSNFGGFQFMLLDEGNHTLQELSQVNQQIVGATKKCNILEGIYASFTANTPQFVLDLDRDKAKRSGVSLTNIFNALQVLMGSEYVNDFNFLNRVYRVYVQANNLSRNEEDDIGKIYVQSDFTNQLVPLSNFIDIHRDYTSQIITHYNLYRSSEIDGGSALGYSSGQALIAMTEIAKKILPEGFYFEWTGLSLEEIQSGKQGIFMFALGLLFVYLFLAAQYESLVDPMIIILAVPLAIFGAMLAQHIRGLDNDVFCQIGLVMLIGLACKNSILIVEFANHLIEKGLKPREAVLESAKTRFRPIMMTSMAFILGIFPLVIATGAGSLSRNSMGTAVFGGMFLSTFLSLFIVPVLFLVAKGLERRIAKLMHKDS